MNLTNIFTVKHSMLASACLALNLGLGKVANVLQLPIYLDTVGTILAAALLPWPLALTVGGLTSCAAGILTHPAFPFYIGTQLAVAAVAVIAVRRGWFARAWSACLTGMIIALIASLVSAPVTAIVFGGVTIPSVTALNALLIASGTSVWTSVISGALVVESIDKVLTCLLVWKLMQRLPPDGDPL